MRLVPEARSLVSATMLAAQIDMLSGRDLRQRVLSRACNLLRRQMTALGVRRGTHIPMPFAANNHIVELGKMPELLEALALMGAKPRI
jgi:hypothetical protein